MEYFVIDDRNNTNFPDFSIRIRLILSLIETFSRKRTVKQFEVISRYLGIGLNEVFHGNDYCVFFQR